MKRFRLIAFSLTFITAFSSCIDDDEATDIPEFPEKNLGTVQANRLIITFIERTDTVSFEFYDADGVGGADPSINEEIMLEYPAASSFLGYDSRVQFFRDNVEVTEDIRNLGTQYVICYRSADTRNLRNTERSQDSNGDPLGLESEWVTVDDRNTNSSTKGMGELRITLNFQEMGKDGSCDAGFRIMEAVMNYRLN